MWPEVSEFECTAQQILEQADEALKSLSLGWRPFGLHEAVCRVNTGMVEKITAWLSAFTGNRTSNKGASLLLT